MPAGRSAPRYARPSSPCAPHLLAARRPALPLQAVPCRDALLAVDDGVALRGVARKRQPFIGTRFGALLEPHEFLRIPADQSAPPGRGRGREHQLVANTVAIARHHAASAVPMQRLTFRVEARPGCNRRSAPSAL